MLQEKYEEWLSNQPDCEDRFPTSRHVWRFFEDVFGEDMIVVLSSVNLTHTPNMRNNLYRGNPCLIVMSKENAKHIENNIRDNILYVKDSYMGQVDVDDVNVDFRSIYNEYSYSMDILELIPCNPVTDDPDRFFTDQKRSSITFVRKDGIHIPFSENVKNPKYMQIEDLGFGSFVSSFEADHVIYCYRLVK